MAKKILKDKAWDLFALYIKLRDANLDGICTCCTCGKELPFDVRECQAGHFVAGRGNAVLYDEKIVHAQCDTCNIWHSGSQGKYVLFMKKKYGHTDEDIEKMLYAKSKPTKLTDADVMELILNFYAVICILISTKFKNNKNIADRTLDKIKKYGLSKMLNLKQTWGIV